MEGMICNVYCGCEWEIVGVVSEMFRLRKKEVGKETVEPSAVC